MSGSTSNPLVAQGSLNRLRGSIVIPNYPALNVTAPYLGREGISLALEGQTTTFIETMTGAVTSPEPYQMVSLTVGMLKTQNIAARYKAQMELAAQIGDVTVTPDTASLPNYSFTNCAIESIREMTFNGENAGFVVVIRGYYNINSSLYNLL